MFGRTVPPQLVGIIGMMEKRDVDERVKKANISRANMYRYFANIDLLFTLASLDIHQKSSDQISDNVNKALKPYKETYSKDTFEKLINTASVLMGIDSIVVCKDVCKLSNNEAENTLKWAIEMILKDIMKENQ